MTDMNVNLQQAAVIDYYVAGICWARDDEKYSEQQVSAVASVLQIIHACIAGTQTTIASMPFAFSQILKTCQNS